jgi:hypothetical protein
MTGTADCVEFYQLLFTTFIVLCYCGKTEWTSTNSEKLLLGLNERKNGLLYSMMYFLQIFKIALWYVF